MNTAKLIPVSEWVYNLYKVSYWIGVPMTQEETVAVLTESLLLQDASPRVMAEMEEAPF